MLTAVLTDGRADVGAAVSNGCGTQRESERQRQFFGVCPTARNRQQNSLVFIGWLEVLPAGGRHQLAAAAVASKHYHFTALAT